MTINKRALAREWLWFAGTLAGVFAVSVWAIGSESAPNILDGFWILLACIYVAITFVRLTVWAVKTTRART
jgi:uncharacterized membrane protein YhdT